MDRQAGTGDTVLVKSREMRGRAQTLPWWMGEKGSRLLKTTENKLHLPLLDASIQNKYGGRRALYYYMHLY
jgi:hypothetical protein